MAHRVDILLDKQTTKTNSEVLDVREFSNISLQIEGMSPGDVIQIWGAIIDRPSVQLRKIKLGTAYDITKDDIYILPPMYRYYQLRVITKVNSLPITAYMYSITDGSFPPQEESIGDFRIGTQDSKFVEEVALTTSFTYLSGFTTNILANEIVYVSNSLFTLKGSGSEVVVTYTQTGGVESTLFNIVLNTFMPTISTSIPGFFEIQRDTTKTGQLRVKAKKYNLDNNYLTGRLVLLRQVL